MDRRDFLKRISAAAAAFTAVAGGGGRALACRPSATVHADTSKFERAIGDAGREVVRLLRKCRATDVSLATRLDGYSEFSVIFEQANDDATRTHLDDQAWQAVESGSLKAVSVCGIDGQRYSIQATWLVPSSCIRSFA